jgi:hypothetical protein
MQNQKIPLLLAYLLPRLQDILFVGILLAGAFYGPKLFNLDGDLGRHITIGNYIITNKTIPTSDIFSHTLSGKTLIPHEWLAQVLFSAIHSLLGLNGDVLLTTLIIAITFTLSYREIITHNSFRLVALFASLWAAMMSSLHWLARPHIFTFLFLAIWTYQLEHVAEKKTSRIWVFPLIMLIWVNTHGAFIAGFVVWGAYAAEWLWEFLHNRVNKESDYTLVTIGILSFAVTFINPSGLLLWAKSVGYIGNKYLVDHTIEYMTPDFHIAATWPFLIALAYFIFSLGGGAKLKLRESILLAGWSIMALYSARNIPLFAIITAPILGRLVQSTAQKIPLFVRQEKNLSGIENQLRGIFLPAISVLLIALAFTRDVKLDSAQLGNHYNPTAFPVSAVNWLEKNPQKGNVFNHFTWGGYLLYREWPRYTVFIDGQTDFYGEDLTREYERLISISEGWEIVLQKYNIEWVIIESNSSLAKELKQQWTVLYEDDTAIILHK